MISRKSDMVTGLGILAGVAILFHETLSIPEPRFEPMGSALLPQIVLGVMAILAIAEIIKAARHHYLPTSEEYKLHKQAEEAGLPVESHEFRHAYRIRTGITLVALIAYAAVLSTALINYYIATFIFSTGLTAYLAKGNRKYTMIGIIVIAIILGLLYVLSRSMNVVLPTM